MSPEQNIDKHPNIQAISIFLKQTVERKNNIEIDAIKKKWKEYIIEYPHPDIALLVLLPEIAEDFNLSPKNIDEIIKDLTKPNQPEEPDKENLYKILSYFPDILRLSQRSPTTT